MAPPPAGLFDALRRLLGTTVGLAQARVELFATDLELEKQRLIGAALRALVGLLLLGVGLLLAVAFVLLLIESQHRMAALGVLALGFLGGGMWLLRAARNHAAAESAFAATAAELARDRDALAPKD
ncbi:MAG: phage holin family protein [Burkholderiales bacterium]|nr:phage holin family protein [Burkholderiales bacterium]